MPLPGNAFVEIGFDKRGGDAFKKALLVGRSDKIHFAAFPIPDDRHVALKTRGFGLGLKEPDHGKLFFFRSKSERTRYRKNDHIDTRRREMNNFISGNKKPPFTTN